MLNRDQAIAFVRAEGNAVELARLDYLLTGKRPSFDSLIPFGASQLAGCRPLSFGQQPCGNNGRS